LGSFNMIDIRLGVTRFADVRHPNDARKPFTGDRHRPNRGA